MVNLFYYSYLVLIRSILKNLNPDSSNPTYCVDKIFIFFYIQQLYQLFLSLLTTFFYKFPGTYTHCCLNFWLSSFPMLHTYAAQLFCGLCCVSFLLPFCYACMRSFKKPISTILFILYQSSYFWFIPACQTYLFSC